MGVLESPKDSANPDAMNEDQESEDETNSEKMNEKTTNSGEATELTAAAVQTKIVRSRKHISNRVRREIWARAQGRCEALDREGRCRSRYQLELDHIIPHARGGADSNENLRLVCRAHNLQHAIESFGYQVMNSYRL